MGKQEAIAFNEQFYQREMPAKNKVIESDFISFLGEYRFEVPEYNFRQGFRNGRLTDPNTGELWSEKGKKAIFQKRSEGLSTVREEAELIGLSSIEEQLSESPSGTIIWFSPKGPEEEGYGDYGFAYIGKRDRDGLSMTAIRLNGSDIDQFNEVSEELGIQAGFQKAENFLQAPSVITKPVEDVKATIKKGFDFTDNGRGKLLEKAKIVFADHFRELFAIIKNGTEDQIQKARNAVEIMIIDFIKREEADSKGNVVYMDNFRAVPALARAMEMTYYTREPEAVKGSCGSSSTKKTQSNGIFTSLSGDFSDNFLSRNKEWFTCPKCNYKADGPVGNTCPGCGLTKEQFAQEAGVLMCE